MIHKFTEQIVLIFTFDEEHIFFCRSIIVEPPSPVISVVLTKSDRDYRVFGINWFWKPIVRSNLNIDVNNANLIAFELNIVGKGLCNKLRHVVAHAVDFEVRDITVLFREVVRIFHRIELHLHNRSSVYSPPV